MLLDQEVLLPRLLEAGADVNAEDLQGWNVLDHIGRRSASPALREALLGAEPEAAAGAVSWPDRDDDPWA